MKKVLNNNCLICHNVDNPVQTDMPYASISIHTADPCLMKMLRPNDHLGYFSVFKDLDFHLNCFEKFFNEDLMKILQNFRNHNCFYCNKDTLASQTRICIAVYIFTYGRRKSLVGFYYHLGCFEEAASMKIEDFYRTYGVCSDTQAERR